MFVRNFIVFVFAAIPLGNLDAAIIQMDFTASAFAPAGGVDSVTGTIRFGAASAFDPIQSLISVDLTIGSHVYLLSELGFSHVGSQSRIGGTAGGLLGMSANTNDLWLIWRHGTHVPVAFAYVTTDNPDTFYYAMNQSLEISAVEEASQSIGGEAPEPATLAIWLLLGGIGLIVGHRRRRKLEQSV